MMQPGPVEVHAWQDKLCLPRELLEKILLPSPAYAWLGEDMLNENPGPEQPLLLLDAQMKPWKK